MASETIFLEALKEASRRARTQSALAKAAGISQSTISDYLNGRYSIGNMTIAMLLRLFPDIRIDFFGEKTGNQTYDLLKAQLLEIFDALDDREKVRMVALNAANFGEKLLKERQQK